MQLFLLVIQDKNTFLGSCLNNDLSCELGNPKCPKHSKGKVNIEPGSHFQLEESNRQNARRLQSRREYLSYIYTHTHTHTHTYTVCTLNLNCIQNLMLSEDHLKIKLYIAVLSSGFDSALKCWFRLAMIPLIKVGDEGFKSLFPVFTMIGIGKPYLALIKNSISLVQHFFFNIHVKNVFFNQIYLFAF